MLAVEGKERPARRMKERMGEESRNQKAVQESKGSRKLQWKGEEKRRGRWMIAVIGWSSDRWFEQSVKCEWKERGSVYETVCRIEYKRETECRAVPQTPTRPDKRGLGREEKIAPFHHQRQTFGCSRRKSEKAGPTTNAIERLLRRRNQVGSVRWSK